MSAELDEQLPRFAEALDRDAPAISVDEILGRGTVAVDVDLLQWPSRGQVQGVAATSWGDATTSSSRNGERDASIEFVSTAAEAPVHRRLGLKVAMAAAAAAVLVVALASIVQLRDEPGPADVPSPTLPAPLPTTPVDPFVGVWLSTDTDGSSQTMEIARSGPEYEVVIRDEATTAARVCGASTLTGAGLLATDTSLVIAQPELTCKDGTTPAIGPPPQAELANFTLDLDTATGELVDSFGVVWQAQVHPAVEAQATERLEEFLAARIAGQGAEGLVELGQDVVDIPLLYATTSGASYERYEIELWDAGWPLGIGTFRVRLFADGDASVIEQEFSWWSGGLGMDDDATIENGQPLVLSHTSSDGEVSVSAPSTWQMYWPNDDGVNQEFAPDVWFGMLWRDGPSPVDDGHNIGFVDPVAYDAWCAVNGGSPLLSAPADAATIAQQLIADPDFDTTAPVTARIGGLEAVSIDVALAPGGRTCGVGMIDISRWIHSLEPGSRLRLYLVDLPKGMSVETLAITVVAPEGDFEEFTEETKPIIESIEFRPG